MKARLSTFLKQRCHLLLVVLALSIYSTQHLAYAARSTDKVADRSFELAPLAPNAEPNALRAGSGKFKVRFTVRLSGKTEFKVPVFLRQTGGKRSFSMNDQGENGDLIARDGIYGAHILIDSSKLKPDSCINYEAFIKRGRIETVSSPLRFCVSSFPVRIAASNTDKPVVLPNGTEAVADEVLVTTAGSTSAAAMRRLAKEINATVVGSIQPMNLYQLKFSSPVNSKRMLEIVAQLRAHDGVVRASVNAIGHGAFTPTDTEFASQHGLKQVLNYDVAGTAVWDAGATGNGVTVTVLDTGIDRKHPDFGTAGSCQLAENDCGAASSDANGHGTQVAGVIAAKTNNGLVGVAGVAYGSKIHSIKVNATTVVPPNTPPIFLIAEMYEAFTDAAAYGVSAIINASFSGGPWYPYDDPVPETVDTVSLCTSINSAVVKETPPGSGIYAPVAVVVNAAGNNGGNSNYYPAKCNDPSEPLHAGLTRKDLFITVANSTSGGTCGSVNQLHSTSNYGSWVDITAPGCDIRTTTRAAVQPAVGSYVSSTGTSFSTPFVSGAAAILYSCGVQLNQIESILKTSGSNVHVSYLPAPNWTPRLDIYRALHRFAPTATNMSAAETYIEDQQRNLTNIVITDLDGCANVTATLTVVPSGAGTLTGGVTTWTMSGTVASVNTALAALTFSPASNYNSTFNITTSVSDGFSPTLTGTKVMTGTAVNDAPVNTIPAPQVAIEDTDKVIGGISVADADAGTANITMTLTATNGTISVNPAVVGGVTAAGIAGNNTASITLTGRQSQINATLANATGVTYHPATNYNGPATLTVVTNDSGASGGPAQTDTDVINIVVAADNDPPETIAGLGNGTEDPTSPIPVSLSGSDIDGTVASFNIVSVPSNGTLSIVGSVPAVGNAATVSYTPNPEFNGTDTFTYASVDNLGLVDVSVATATITVTPVNDPPETTAGLGNGTEDPTSPIPVTLSGSDIDGTVASFNIVSVPSNGTLSIVGSVPAVGNAATVSYTPNPDFNGTDTFTYASVDNLGLVDASAATATITVTPVNDPPTILGQPISFSHIEFNQIANAWPSGIDDSVGILSASDVDNGPLTFSITAGNEVVVNNVNQQFAFKFDGTSLQQRQLVVDNELALNYEYLPPADPSFNLTIEVTDGVALPVTANVKVTLTNDANDNGDPHITTVRGLRYDFQSAGEFVALRGAKGMEIQTRQTPIPGPAPFTDPYSGLAVGVSINTAVAARVGDYRVTYQPNDSGVPELRINGDVTTLPANGVDLGVGGRVIPLGANSIQVDFPDGTTMTVSAYLWGSLSYMQIDVMHTPAREGLMGINTAGSWLPRLADGTSFGAMPSALCDRFVELYEKFADSWRVTDDTSLFDYDDDPVTSTSTFTSVWPLEKPLCAAPSIAATPRPTTVAVAAPVRRIAPVAPRGIVLKPVAKQVAQQHCRAIAGKNEKANCIFDVMFTGNTGFARAYQRTEKLRAGLTSVVVRAADKLNDRGDMVVTATVARHATVVPKVKGLSNVPAGTVQFMLGDKTLDKPVKLDAKGQAKLVVTRQNLEHFNAGKLPITARYLPAKDKANVFLPAISRQLTREMKPVDKVIRETKEFPRRLK